MSNLGFSPSAPRSPAFGAMARRMSPQSKALRMRLVALEDEDLRRVAADVGSTRWSVQDLMNWGSDNQTWERVHAAIDALTPPEEVAPPADIVTALVEEHFAEDARRPASVDPIEDPEPALSEPSIDRFAVARRSDGVELGDDDRALLARAQDLAGSADFMALGEALAALVNGGVHRRLGYADERSAVAAFLETEAGVAGRKAMYILRIGRRLSGSPLRSRIEKLGWTKAKEIAGLKDESLHKDAVAFAETHGVRDLVEHCRRLRDGEPKTGSHRRLVLTVTASGEGMIRQALDTVRRRSGKPDLSDGFALQLAVAEWLLSEGDLSLAEGIAALEERFGVKLVESRE
ncbi:hypothetical protein [Aureimonas sp. AU40]|uniref:hypothetical protein n=1 Tax=Aureimonas sp. AU40 TaxID=1637747 RepID=UPI000782A71E|nr:hypothetical protein [Aureimonas sp. AU40]